MRKDKRHCNVFSRWMFLILLWVIIFGGISTSYGFNLGKTYDSSNWQEITKITTPSLINWVKQGDFIVKTAKLNFDFRLEQAFLSASKKNQGIFNVNEKGFIIEIKTSQQPSFIYGLPFPSISIRDPKSASKIMANFYYTKMRLEGYICPHRYVWIGKAGMERQIQNETRKLYYQGRPGGPIQNPNNFLSQQLGIILAPMDMAGSLSLSWEYNDERQATRFSYVSRLRRIRKVSSSTRSNPAVGSDLCSDDVDIWNGKNEDFKWKLLGEKEILCCFSAVNKINAQNMANGAVKWVPMEIQLGYEIPNWTGAPWAPVNAFWTTRPVWIVEGVPKDPKYNFGRLLFYVDKDTYNVWFKECYNQSGEYWKTIFAIQSFQMAPSGRTSLLYPDAILAIDDQKHHATFKVLTETESGKKNTIYCPLSVLGPNDFTVTSAQQMSK